MSKLLQMFLPNVPDPGPAPNRFDDSIDGFFTSPQDADALVGFARITPDMRVLEPAAGEGAIVHALMRLPEPPAQIVAVELHEPFFQNLRASCEQYGDRVQIVHADYFKVRAASGKPFDVSLMNPPYQKFLDARFVQKSLTDALKVTALLLASSLHNPKRAKVWNASHVERIDFLARRPDAFENGKPICHKPMREYVHVSACRTDATQGHHTTIVRFV